MTEMQGLKDKVLKYIKMGMNVSVIGFPGDGLYYLFEDLLKVQGGVVEESDELVFVNVSFTYLDNISVQNVEAEIESGLRRSPGSEQDIYATIDNKKQIVCIFNDLAFVADPLMAINVADGLIQKYKSKLRFIFLIEDPLLISNLSGKVSADSALLDAFVYQAIGKEWNAELLEKQFYEQFGQTLQEGQLEAVMLASGCHFATFKRLYLDAITGGKDATNRYLNILLENLPPYIVNMLKKFMGGVSLSKDEEVILSNYQRVGLLCEGQVLAIPRLQEQLSTFVIKNKLSLNSEGCLAGLDLNLLSKVEQSILETLFKNEVVSKGEIGNIIWPQNKTERYSEWAIDKRIERLRVKLRELSFNISIITVYGKGYRLNQL